MLESETAWPSHINLSHSGVAIKLIADNMLKIEANRIFIFTQNNFTGTNLQIR